MPTPSRTGSGADTASLARPTAIPASVVLAAAIPVSLPPHRLPARVHGGCRLRVRACGAIRLCGARRRRHRARRRSGRHGFAPLRAGWPVWPAGGPLRLPRRRREPLSAPLGRRVRRLHARGHGGEVREYALLAPAVPLLLRRARDLELVLGALVRLGERRPQPSVCCRSSAWTSSTRGSRAGASRRFSATTTLRRSVELRFSSRSSARLRPAARAAPSCCSAQRRRGAVGVRRLRLGRRGARLAAGPPPRYSSPRTTAGSPLRRALASLGALIGAVAVRHPRHARWRRRPIRPLPRHRRQDPSAQENVQTYVQRTMLAYIGWQIFLDHPIAGAGWQASSKEEQVYGDYLDDARREFPDAPALAFPSPEHPYGTQNAYIQALADLGVIGFCLLLATFAAGLLLAAPGGAPRAARHGPARRASPARGCCSSWGRGPPSGSSPASPSTRLTWIALGLAAAASEEPRLAAPDVSAGASTAGRGRAASRTTCAPRSPPGFRPRRFAPPPTSAATACSTSAAATSPTPRSSSRTCRTTSASTSATRPPISRARSRRCPVPDNAFDLVLCTQVWSISTTRASPSASCTA